MYSCFAHYHGYLAWAGIELGVPPAPALRTSVHATTPTNFDMA